MCCAGQAIRFVRNYNRGVRLRWYPIDFCRPRTRNSLINAPSSAVVHSSDGWPREAILTAVPDAAALLDALAEVDRAAGPAYLTGLAAGYAHRAAEVAVETVWSGPGSPHVPVRATAAVLADVVREVRRELLLMTYSARRFQPLTAALQAAVGRGGRPPRPVRTSANLTQSGVGKNIEAGLLIRGGAAPARAAEHVDALRASGDLIRLN